MNFLVFVCGYLSLLLLLLLLFLFEILLLLLLSLLQLHRQSLTIIVFVVCPLARSRLISSVVVVARAREVPALTHTLA